jgi:transposase
MTQADRILIQEKLLGRYLTKFQRQLLEQQLEIETISEYRKRIEIVLLADDGRTQTQICREVGCSPLTVRHWMLMAKSGQGHDWQSQPIGRPKVVNSAYLDRLKELVGKSPKDFGYSFPRWTGQWLSKHLSREFNIEVSARHINRLIEKMDVEDESSAESKPQIGKSQHLTISNLHDRRHAS